MQDSIYKTADLNEVAYLLTKKNQLIDIKETSDKNAIFEFKKTQQLEENLNDFYARKNDFLTLLETLKSLKFALHHKEILNNLVQRFKIR